MSVKLKKQPYCRWCGKPIAKRTTNHCLWKFGTGVDYNNPVTLDDCRKKTNEQVVSVKYSYYTDEEGNTSKTMRSVYSYNTWDGESYVDEYFCNGQHARNLGYAAAAKGWNTHNYREARDKCKP